MSVLGWLANGWAATLFIILGLVSFVLTLWMAITYFDQYANKRKRVILAVVFLLSTFLFGLGSHFSLTHRVIPFNQQGIVLDKTTGSIVGSMRESGLTTRPILSSEVKKFPAGTQQEVCWDFLPSVKGGYEVKLTTCFYLDLSRVDWVEHVTEYNTFNFETIKAAWGNQLAPKVAEAVKEYTPANLTAERGAVVKSINTETGSWFEAEQVPLVRVSLAFWDFTNPEVAKAFDDTVVAQTLSAKEQAEFDAAAIERQTKNYKADTDIQVLEKLTRGQLDAMRSLGIESEDAVIRFLTLQWLLSLERPPENLIISTTGYGNMDVQPCVPTQ